MLRAASDEYVTGASLEGRCIGGYCSHYNVVADSRSEEIQVPIFRSEKRPTPCSGRQCSLDTIIPGWNAILEKARSESGDISDDDARRKMAELEAHDPMESRKRRLASN